MDEIKEVITDNYAIYNLDCIEVMKQFPNASIHFQIDSPPFGTKDGALFNYTSLKQDLSNNLNYEKFLEHYEFVAEQCARIMMPGRMKAVHCMDTGQSNSGHGDPLLNFPDDLIEIYCKCRKDDCTASKLAKRKGLCGHGWFTFNIRTTIWKEPLMIRNRLMLKKLSHYTTVTDATSSGNAQPDYLLFFQRKGKNPIPVIHKNGFLDYYGSQEIPKELLKYKKWTGKQTENRYSHWIWRNYASSVWMDIRTDNILPYKPAKAEEDERHLHALQLDVIARAIQLFTNPGEKVWSSFMGVSSEVYQAVKMGRIGLGAEIKRSYFNQAVKNLANIEVLLELELKDTQLSMFDQMA